MSVPYSPALGRGRRKRVLDRVAFVLLGVGAVGVIVVTRRGALAASSTRLTTSAGLAPFGTGPRMGLDLPSLPACNADFWPPGVPPWLSEQCSPLSSRQRHCHFTALGRTGVGCRLHLPTLQATRRRDAGGRLDPHDRRASSRPWPGFSFWWSALCMGNNLVAVLGVVGGVLGVAAIVVLHTAIRYPRLRRTLESAATRSLERTRRLLRHRGDLKGGDQRVVRTSRFAAPRCVGLDPGQHPGLGQLADRCRGLGREHLRRRCVGPLAGIAP